MWIFICPSWNYVIWIDFAIEITITDVALFYIKQFTCLYNYLNWMRIVILIPYWITSLCHVTGTHFVICQWCFLNKDKVCMYDWYVMRDVCNGLNQLCCRRYSDIHIIFIIRCPEKRNSRVYHVRCGVQPIRHEF
jgi:hypothetical protein